jgi:hypothetical protein
MMFGPYDFLRITGRFRHILAFPLEVGIIGGAPPCFRQVRHACRTDRSFRSLVQGALVLSCVPGEALTTQIMDS